MELKPLATIAVGDVSYSFYVGLGALLLNIAIAAVATVVMGLISPNPRSATARP
jgi:SSS family solute:Na+ symporter